MLDGVRHADWSTLRNAEQREWLADLSRIDDRFQILDPALKRQITDIQIGHSAAALVITNVAEIVAEKSYPMPPDRTLPFILEMRQPVRGLDHHRSRTRLRPGELDAIGSTQVTNSLRGLLHYRISHSSIAPVRATKTSPKQDECPAQ